MILKDPEIEDRRLKTCQIKYFVPTPLDEFSIPVYNSIKIIEAGYITTSTNLYYVPYEYSTKNGQCLSKLTQLYTVTISLHSIPFILYKK